MYTLHIGEVSYFSLCTKRNIIDEVDTVYRYNHVAMYSVNKDRGNLEFYDC
jgi:hypothetical protein